MDGTIRVTAVVENTAGARDMLTEHGLAFWIDTGSRRVLFDTGQGKVLRHNARRLGVRLELADAIVLSHGHYDHTGGLGQALRTAPRAKVYAHPAALRPKYARNDDGTARDLGIPSLDEETVRKQASELVWTRQPTEFCDGLFVTGEIPRVTAFEDTGGPFFLDRDCQHPDPLIDDQCVFFQCLQGTVVLLGCAHAGVVNTLRYVEQLTGNRPIHAVMGGMHLGGASRERMNHTILAFSEFDIRHLGPAHCTGMAATAELCTAFPERCFACRAGTTMAFETA